MTEAMTGINSLTLPGGGELEMTSHQHYGSEGEMHRFGGPSLGEDAPVVTVKTRTSRRLDGKDKITGIDAHAHEQRITNFDQTAAVTLGGQGVEWPPATPDQWDTYHASVQLAGQTALNCLQSITT